MRIVRSLSLAVALLCALARPAAPDSIFVASPFSGGAFDAIGMTPFDPSMGTLDKVLVSIAGTLSVSGSTLPNLVPVGVTLVPLPYDYRIDVTQDFEGLAGGYFDLNDDTTFSMIGHATGSGEAFALATTFSVLVRLRLHLRLDWLHHPVGLELVWDLHPSVQRLGRARGLHRDRSDRRGGYDSVLRHRRSSAEPRCRRRRFRHLPCEWSPQHHLLSTRRRRSPDPEPAALILVGIAVSGLAARYRLRR